MNDKKTLENLRQDILSRFGHTLECPADFDAFVLKVQEATGESISATTVKRLFGYIPTDAVPRKSSLGILTRYLGYAGWSDYVAHRDADSGFIATRILPASRVREGDMVRVTWGADRDVTFVALADGRFAVADSVNSKLKEGDSMTIMMFMAGQPLQVKDVIRHGENIGNYTAGLNGGLTSVDIIS